MKKIFAGNTPLNFNKNEVAGELIEFENETYYKISNYNNMSPFFMTITSDSDHWMFISSNGGLTCGRKDRENALFPYYTDDKIHDSHVTTGPKSILLIQKDANTYLWEPFSNKYWGVYNLKRNIYKNITGNKIIFEEINESLNITFSYAWKNSDKYGFVKESLIKNNGNNTLKVDIVDGIRNILPYGVTSALQSDKSTLVDGYKKCELIKEIGLGIYTLSSILTDKAEPSEALKSTLVWSLGLKAPNYLFTDDQLNKFISGESVTNENSLKGRKGSYFLNVSFNLENKAQKSWLIVAELSQSHSQVINLVNQLKDKKTIGQKLSSDIEFGTTNLQKLIANADGIQKTGNKLNNCRHSSNTLFNIMRGGIYFNNYSIPKNDFINHIATINPEIAQKHRDFLNGLSNNTHYGNLISQAEQTNDSDLERICMEYLPLTFSRRHGDPSRPWNFFSIDVKNNNGSKKLNYEGNWRDIFQNWEALSYSFPNFIEGIIAKFVNASTADGYNPYRITKNGIDWEILDPKDPWSNIGYWGDHQIIYLQKLLEVSSKFNPKKLNTLLNKRIFVYANVPYQIKAYNDIIKNPYNTIEYNNELELLIGKRTQQFGSDGKLVFIKQNEVYKVNLAEKLLLPLLTKLSNFVPNGGIWLNTQRPEWNDANNALVGYGLSMVTVYYLHRYLNFLIALFRNADTESFELSTEVSQFFQALNAIYSNQKITSQNFTPEHRKKMVDGLGKAGTTYRNSIYKNGFCAKAETIPKSTIVSFLSTTIKHISNTIDSNKKGNGLYHSYNLIDFKPDGIDIIRLNDMLEGQVAVLSSGILKAVEAVSLLDSIKESDLYRANQDSYMLYPDKELPNFLQKNNIDFQSIEKSEYLSNLLETGDKTIIEQDINGTVHFNGDIKNTNQLNQLLKTKGNVPDCEIEFACKLYFESFNHRQFTGRSGTFFKYEGLGSIYWHMVSKLVLAIQECYYDALNVDADASIVSKLKDQYYAVKNGLGLSKNPAEYGAFPIDPYSHTPSFAGVQQPGMTGQVKEDFISRFGELGLQVKDGKIHFSTRLIKKDEFCTNNSLEFTFCGTSIKYVSSNNTKIIIDYTNGSTTELPSNVLDYKNSQSVFNRHNEIKAITVYMQLNF